MRDYIALAVPAFFVLIGAELWWARLRGRAVYRLNDAITDVSCGITAQMAGLLFKAALLGIYAWVYENYRLHTFSSSWATWLCALVGVDFAYYWWHRASHEVNFMWAAHVVHHQSEDYNLAVALRQGVLTSWTSLPFYLPLALLGVPLLVYVAALGFSTLYQFWIHTQLIGKMKGPLPYVLNLPQHHRVHHAINPPYLDKNYGATSIVWDRLFGSYADEHEQPVYGITKPLASFNPLWAQVHYWAELAKLTARADRPLDKLRAWFKPPSWQPAVAGVPVATDSYTRASTVSPDAIVKYGQPLSRPLGAYVLLQHALLIMGAATLLLFAKSLPRGLMLGGIAMVLVGVLTIGALIEHKSWAKWAEGLRVASLLALLAALSFANGD